MQAIILAAGFGKRLGKYTENNTKCMVEVAGKKIIDRLFESLKTASIKDVTVVLGYCGNNLSQHLKKNYSSDFNLNFVNNELYGKTNNIYSLFLASETLAKDNTVLFESDVVFENELVNKLVKNKNENIAVVAKYKEWMDGAGINIDKNSYVDEIIKKSDIDYHNIRDYYKTVNIYKFSKEFSKKYLIPKLKSYIKSNKENEYYETTLKVIVEKNKKLLKAMDLKDMAWYEIDTPQDLDIANVLFETPEKKFEILSNKFGGYWRYGGIDDFCYLVNPYYPSDIFLEKMGNISRELINNYPAGQKTQNGNMSLLFNVKEKYLIGGNGASELINYLGQVMKGRFCVPIPTFNEYLRCFENCNIIPVNSSKHDYDHEMKLYKEICEIADALCIICPNLPSGSFIQKKDIIELLDFAKENGTDIIFDESFIDFADKKIRYTLISDEILEKYPNLIVIKSIGKSYGVGGLRLGVLATSNKKILKAVSEKMQIWNINSFADYFLQTSLTYSKEYVESCDRIGEERKILGKKLSEIKGIKVYPSQANFFMLKITGKKARNVCVELLDRHKLLIKDLSEKKGIKDNLVRVAIKSREENNILAKALKDVMEN